MMQETTLERIEINIVCDGLSDYALRFWPAVPRVGDEIMLRRDGSVLAPSTAIVRRVVWGTSSGSEEVGGRLRVSVCCEWRQTADG